MQVREIEVREMLRRRVRDMSMPATPSPSLLQRGWRTRKRTRAVALASALLVLVGLPASVGAILADAPDPPRQAAFDSTAPRPPSAGLLRVVDYQLRVGSETAGPGITLEDVQRHAACMRSQGFALPNPTETEDGWSIVVADPASKGLDMNNAKFRQAFFVTCGPFGAPLSGDLVMAGSQASIDRFVSCMGEQGFNLPTPMRDASGRYDSEEWEFDLTKSDIDTSTDTWNKAAFVTCFQGDTTS